MKAFLFGLTLLNSISAFASVPDVWASVHRCMTVDSNGNSHAIALIGASQSKSNSNGQLDIQTESYVVEGEKLKRAEVRFTSSSGETLNLNVAAGESESALADTGDCSKPSDAGKLYMGVSLD